MKPGTITALKAEAQDSKRVNVFVDGVFALGVSLDTLAREGLFVGKEVSAEEAERIAAAENANKAYLTGLQFLASRPRSEHEIRERLARKQFAPDAITQAIERLRTIGLVDDTAFARLWVENRLAYRPRGAAALRSELRGKGVDRQIADALLADDELLGDERGRAEEVARAALHRYAAAPDRATFQRRLGGYLQRRGFGYDTVGPLIDQLWNETKEQPDDDL